MNILLIEDHLAIIKGLDYAFSKTPYNLIYKTNLTDTLQYFKVAKPDLILLDVSLPDGDGFAFYQSHIKMLEIPTIFLTAKDEEDDIVKGLHLGAEDYITKPFSTKELLARIDKVFLRIKKENIIRIKDISFDLDKFILLRGEEEIELTSLERKLVHLLFVNRNKVVTRNTILNKIWEWTGNDVDDHTVTVYFKRIREKLGTNIITTIKGIGYIIDEKQN